MRPAQVVTHERSAARKGQADMADAEIRVVGFAGSLREKSFNRALLQAAKEMAPPVMALDIFDLRDVPLYNADVEAAGDPPAVAALKDAIRAADGVLMVTPEYNHGVPGVMKNAVDWCSRPPQGAALAHKPVALMGASPGITGSARGQSQLRQAFEFTNSYCMPQPEFLLFQAHQKIDADGRLTDEASRAFLEKFLLAFADWIRLFPANPG